MGLLKKDPTQRMGTVNGASEIKNHPWFEGINWNALYHKKYEAPFVPKIGTDADLTHFDPEFTEIPIVSMSENENKMMDVINQQQFAGFSYNVDSNTGGIQGEMGMDIEN